MIKKYLNTFLISLTLLLTTLQCVFIGYIYLNKENNTESVNTYEKISFENEETIEKEESLDLSFFVEIKGAVNNPGVYKVNNDNIINDVITLAGGLKNNAYTNNINLSKKVQSEMVIYIYTGYEYSQKTKKEVVECNCPKEDISKCLDTAASVITSDETKPETNTETNVKNDTSSKTLININTADLNTLTSLSGIGNAKAQKIIDYREKNGLFKSIDEIKNVSGISEKLFNEIKEFITV